MNSRTPRKPESVGQMPRPNTWMDILPHAIPEDKLITTNALFQTVSEKHRHLEFHVCGQTLCVSINGSSSVVSAFRAGRMRSGRGGWFIR